MIVPWWTMAVEPWFIYHYARLYHGKKTLYYGKLMMVEPCRTLPPCLDRSIIIIKPILFIIKSYTKHMTDRQTYSKNNENSKREH